MRFAYQNYHIFKLLVSKSLLKTKKHKLKYLSAVLTPVLFSIVIIILGTVNKQFRESSELAFRDVEYDLWWTKVITKITQRRERMIRERPE